MGSKGPTLHEVASRAGVSIATVSRVARGLDKISAETRSRVLAAIEDLNYRPSHFGQALVKRRHGTLGIVFPGLRGPYYAEVIHGFELEGIAARMSLLILGTEMLQMADQQVLSMADRADGIAIMGGSISDELTMRLAARGVPVATMARPALPGIPSVRVDNVGSTRELTLHLIREHDHRHLVFVGNIDGAPDAAERWQGFLQAHAEAGLEPPAHPFTSAFEPQAGVQAGSRVLEMTPRPTAVVCANDEIASGILSSFAARGVTVPEDIAVTGWDDGPHAQYSAPPLTTVRQPARKLGQHTASTLLNLIAGTAVSDDDVVLATEPVYRASCGCPFDPVSWYPESGMHEEGMPIEDWHDR